jgi:hypothetical protein
MFIGQVSGQSHCASIMLLAPKAGKFRFIGANEPYPATADVLGTRCELSPSDPGVQCGCRDPDLHRPDSVDPDSLSSLKRHVERISMAPSGRLSVRQRYRP